MSDLRTVPPIVRPRKPFDESRYVIAVARGQVLLESTGEVFDRAELPNLVATEPSSIIACENAAALLMQLNERFGTWPIWSWRVTPVIRRVYRQHAQTNRPTEAKDAVVNYFGFRYESESGRTKTHYHYPIDTLTFLSGNSGAEFTGFDVQQMLAWGVDVRNFCAENRMKISATSGGLAAQLLRDARFSPARRKVPKATNARARDHLPGNHYELFIPEDTTVRNAYYLDMRGAHHYAASQVTFPNPDRMYGRGLFRHPPEIVTGYPWARHGSPKYRSVMNTHGLFLLRINVPSHLQKSKTAFPPPWLRKPAGIRHAWVYSNEFPLLARHSVSVEGVEAAWTASTSSDHLNRYAAFATAETATMDDRRKRWAKPTLLAVYGLLAARPRTREFGYPADHARVALKGEAKLYPTHGGMLAVSALSTSREMESPVVNVILRGMIEAQVRMEVLTLARDLHSRGIEILALYADSVIVRPTAALPLLPPPWTVKTELTRLTFFNPVSFVSDELERLPGLTPEGRARLSLRSVWRTHRDGLPGRRLAARIVSAATHTPDGPPVPWASNKLDIIEVDGRREIR